MTIPHDPQEPEIREPDENDVPEVPDRDVPDEAPERQEPDYRAPGDSIPDSPMRMPGDNPDVETEI